MSVKKIIQLTENDLEKIVKRIIKEEAGTDLLTNALNVMVKNGLVDMENVNVYKGNFEVYGFNKGPREYFLDNHIVFEVGGVDELFLNFVSKKHLKSAINNKRFPSTFFTYLFQHIDYHAKCFTAQLFYNRILAHTHRHTNKHLIVTLTPFSS